MEFLKNFLEGEVMTIPACERILRSVEFDGMKGRSYMEVVERAKEIIHSSKKEMSKNQYKLIFNGSLDEVEKNVVIRLVNLTLKGRKEVVVVSSKVQ